MNLARCSAFEHLWRSVLPSSEKDSLIGMFLTGYFDESGTHAGAKFAVVAGYLATVVQWRGFESRWRQEILEGKQIKVLHRVDLEYSEAEFQGWSEERRRGVIQRASKIIQECTLTGVGAAVSVAAFEEFIPIEFRAYFGGVYGWCGHQ